MNQIITGIRQVSIVVPDLEKTVKYYTEKLGFSDWDTFEITKENCEEYPHYTHGELRPIAFKGAKGMIGNFELEFMQPVCDTSVYAEFLEKNNLKPGVHHLFVEVTNFDEAFVFFKGLGYEVMQTAITPFQTEVAYFDSSEELGFCIEIGGKKVNR